jgi:type IV pilus assembly protein PilA
VTARVTPGPGKDHVCGLWPPGPRFVTLGRVGSSSRQGFTLIELMIVIALIAIIAAIAIPNMLSARKSANEGAAIGHLKTITNAQHIFSVSDKDNDNSPDYATMAELSESQILDAVLGSGRRQGYLFECGPTLLTPEACWFAVANPIQPQASGDRYFATNQRGVIFYTNASSITPDYTDASIPSELSPLR